MTILEYHRPSSPAEALALMERAEIKTVALVPCPRPPALSDLKAQAVVDLSGLDLAHVSVGESEVRLGAGTPVQTLVESPELKAVLHGVIPEAARLAGHFGLRQMSTLEGALLTRKILPELTLVLLALDALVVTVKSDGSQVEKSLAEYLVFQASGGELLLEVKWQVEPGENARVGAAMERVARAPRDHAVMAAAAVLHMENKICRQARVTLSHAGEAAELLVAIIARLEDREPTPDLLQSVAESVQAAIQPKADYRGSAEYRRELAGVLTRRALENAWKRATDRFA